MSLIELLSQASKSINKQDFGNAKECLENALNFKMDVQTKSMIYDQLGMCCFQMNKLEDAMVYFELLAANENYEYIDETYENLARLYRDSGRFDDMYRITKKIAARPRPANLIRQPEQLFYELWQSRNEPDAAALYRQRQHIFEYSPKISLVVPVYNVKTDYLHEMLKSVCAQTYANWELCIADGNSDNNEIRTIILSYAGKDSRIKYVFLNENLGISENTNEAVKLSSGEYIGFLDHDDCLSADALYEIASVLEADKSLEFIYTDHDRVVHINDTYKRMLPVFKPAWSPILFEQDSYIVHFVVVKRELLMKIGLLKKQYDGFQDTDLIYRITDATDKIFNIQKILYHWRIHPDSVGAGINFTETKVEEAVLLMKTEHFTRAGVPYDNSGKGYAINDNPKVSIIILNKNNSKHLKRCIKSIYMRSGYDNFEIIIMDKGSTERDTLSYYEDLKQNKDVTILYKNNNQQEGIEGYSPDYNYASQFAKGEFLVFMSATCEQLSRDWLYAFLQMQQSPQAGVTGGKINYLDDDGIVKHVSGIQFTGSEFNAKYLYGYNRKKTLYCPDICLYDDKGYSHRCATALDHICIIIKKELFINLGQFDHRFPFSFFVFDLCLKCRKLNKYNMWINALEINYEQKRDVYYEDALNNFESELQIFEKEWMHELEKDDPFMNINLSADNYERNGCFFAF